jgi:hypothetical protein
VLGAAAVVLLLLAVLASAVGMTTVDAVTEGSGKLRCKLAP